MLSRDAISTLNYAYHMPQVTAITRLSARSRVEVCKTMLHMYQTYQNFENDSLKPNI